MDVTSKPHYHCAWGWGSAGRWAGCQGHQRTGLSPVTGTVRMAGSGAAGRLLPCAAGGNLVGLPKALGLHFTTLQDTGA